MLVAPADNHSFEFLIASRASGAYLTLIPGYSPLFPEGQFFGRLRARILKITLKG